MWLDGYENTNIDPENVAKQIVDVLNIKATDRVLEVGCSAGLIAQYIAPYCKYYGVDYTESLIKKHREILNNNVRTGHANDIPFKNQYFDKSFAFSVFQYFPDKEYVKKVINEMKRVTKDAYFIGDLPIKSHDKDHLLFDIADFDGGLCSIGYYNHDRFNVVYKWREEGISY